MLKPLQTINEAARTTGLSAKYLRAGCREGRIPFIKTGEKYLINIPALLKQLDIPENWYAQTEAPEPAPPKTAKVPRSRASDSVTLKRPPIRSR